LRNTSADFRKKSTRPPPKLQLSMQGQQSPLGEQTMASRTARPLNRLVHGMRRIALLGNSGAVSDARLLESFLTHRDETAFEALVRRHAPMVLGVCTRVIGNVHDAEDAFQAVFLVLARKAACVTPRDLVGNWLYGVAYRTALQARVRLSRRRMHERQVPNMPEPLPAPALDFSDLHQALDRELTKLPEKYRAPIVLCDLEGKSRKDVAALLKIPEGTLSSRLAKGRSLLAKRLTRYGIALSAAPLAAQLGQHSALAASPALVSSTVQAAMLMAAGKSAAGVVAAEVIALSQGALKTMFLAKINVLAVVVLGIVVGSLGAGAIGQSARDTAPAVMASSPNDPQQLPAADPEPLAGGLLLQEQVQKELRLSENQLKRIRDIAHDVDVASAKEHAEIKQLEKQIEEMQQRIRRLQDNFEKQRTESLAKAAPDILSAQALLRLRQIQRQMRTLDQILEDPRCQRALKLNDEQIKKLEHIAKTESRISSDGFQLYTNDLDSLGLGLVTFRYDLRPYVSFRPNQQMLRKQFEVLTPAQQRTLAEWVGEPYWTDSWQIIRNKKD
jgi:RNA polymerase sigma factor (sigma-70 family)